MKTVQVYIDIVKKYFPNLSDEEADKVLWGHTPFPMRDDIQEIERYLIEYKESLDVDEHMHRFTVPYRETEVSNSTRFAEFLEGLSEDQYNNFEENIKGDLQKYE